MPLRHEPSRRWQRPVIAISMGDPSGIGPEVIARSLARRAVSSRLVPVIFGDPATLERAAARARVRLPRLRVLAAPEHPTGPAIVPLATLSQRDARPGKPSLEGARAQAAWVEAAATAVAAGLADALVTGPISKLQLDRAGTRFRGHTEWLGALWGGEPLMMLIGGGLRVALATNHVPLAAVPRRVTAQRIESALRILADDLRVRFRIARPRIAVCGLNPHAGEGGLLGTEDARVVAPAVRASRRAGLNVDGPLPADGLFAHGREAYDAILALYHDQGLAPLKAVACGRGVNVTLGLPHVRTSPDHGTAYTLAARGGADPASMIEALLLAAALAPLARRRRYGRNASPRRGPLQAGASSSHGVARSLRPGRLKGRIASSSATGRFARTDESEGTE